MLLRSVFSLQSFLVVLAFSMIAQPVEAAIVVFRFEGVVTDVPVALNSEFNVGETIEGSYAFESTSSPDVGGNFIGAVLSFEGMIGDYKFVTSGLGDIGVDGGYTVAGFTQANNVGSQVAILHAIQLLGGSLTPGVLPLQPPDLGQFSARLFTLDFLAGPRLIGQIDSISIVPEPSSLAICFFLLGAQVLRRTKRQDSNTNCNA